MKRYWLVLFPDTFLWIKNSDGIIYNSKNFKHFTFRSSEAIHELYDSLSDLDSLYSVELTESLLFNKQIKQWVDQIIDIDAGCLIEQNGENKKPISYYPFLSIQKGFKHIKWEHELNIGGKIINNLHELVFYVNGSMNGSDENFRQAYYPLKTNVSLDFNLIRSFIEQCNNEMLTQITFIGNPFNYSSFNLLQEWLLSNNHIVQFVMLVEDIEKDISKFESLNSDKIRVTGIVNNYSAFTKQSKLYQHIAENVSFVFYIKSVNEVESVSSIMEELGIKNYTVVPFYDGTNKKFFEENVYMTKDEFDAIKLSKREIYSNMTLNTYYFGKLTIMPDGKIFSNVNNTPLGALGDPIYDMIYKEMTEGETWFGIRDTKSCRDCIYQWLCPSPSNYELAIGKPNLCHISE